MKLLLKTTLLTTALLLATQATYAQKPAESAKAPAQTRSSDKVDLKQLEDKYWSAKDEDYSVIQNRTFSKAGKFYLSAVYGTLVNDSFAKGSPMGAYLGYYFNEDFGIEGSYLLNNSVRSDSVNKFNTLAANISPNYNLPGTSMTLSATYTPFYAKMAFMNMAILYFDMGFTAGIGTTNYDQIVRLKDTNGNIIQEGGKISQSAPHFEIGIMQQLFLSKNFAFRLDIKNSFYNEKVANYDVPASGVRVEETSMKNNTMITFGLTLFTN